MGYVPTGDDLAYLEGRFSFAESLPPPVPPAFLEAVHGVLPDSYADDTSKANDAYRSLVNFFQISD